jgi:asparagine synthase (glutamine-hydrolysing)
MSMAVGLEVRVPYCDHRLVEYVYNVPWALKTFDRRENSLLRAVARDILPESIANRPKCPYPSTQDPQYAIALRQEAGKLLREPAHPVFEIVDRGWLSRAVADAARGVTQGERSGLERTLDLAVWLNMYEPN